MEHYPEITIGAISFEWCRVTYRVLFAARKQSLAEIVLQEIVNSLRSYCARVGILFVIFGEDGLVRYDGKRLDVNDFLVFVRQRQLYGRFILLIEPGVFLQKPAAQKARALWIRSRPLGAPAIAVCEAVEPGLWCDFGSDACMLFYLFDSEDALPSELLVHTDGTKMRVVEVLPGVFAVCMELLSI